MGCLDFELSFEFYPHKKSNVMINSRFFNTSILLLFIFSSFTKVLNAKQFINHRKDFYVEYSDCGGYIDIFIRVQEPPSYCPTRPRMQDMHVYYKEPNGTRRLILQWNGQDFQNSNLTATLSGFNFYGYYPHPNTQFFVVPSQDTKLGVPGHDYLLIRWYEVPVNFLGTQTTISLDGIFLEDHILPGISLCTGNISFNNIEETSPTQQAKAEAAPTGLTTTQDAHCDKINLRWNNPSNTATNCGNGKNHTAVFRKPVGSNTWGHIADVQFPATSYDDSGVPRGIKYNYRVQHWFIPNQWRHSPSGYSNVVTGRSGGAVDPPTNVTVTNDDCNDRISISWDWTGPFARLGGFSLYRRVKSPQGPWINLSSTISDNDRSYNDEAATPELEYEYRLHSLNECNPAVASIASAFVTGLRPGTPSEPTGVNSTVGSNNITIMWTPPVSNNTTGFILERSFPGAGAALIIDVPNVNDTSYIDTDVNLCVTYTYKVKTKSLCFPDGVGTQTASGLIMPDLSTAFPTDGSGLRASKGYFSDKVELSWTNNLSNLTNAIKIFRRILGSGDPFSLLTTLNSGSGIYNDIFTEAGELYEYEIVGQAPCENVTIESNKVRTIGYRRKTGIVTGNVSYTGGIAVENVRIVANDPSNIEYPSLQFASTDSATIDHAASLNMSDGMIAESWLKPLTCTSDFSIIKKDSAYQLGFDMASSQYKFTIFTNNGPQSIAISKDSLPLNQWFHLAGIFFNDSLKLFVSGQLVHVEPVIANSQILTSTQPVILGKDFDGFLKEIRLWNGGKTDNRMAQDYSRFLAGSEAKLVLYLNAGERRGNFAYDLSRIGNSFWKNHARLSDPAMWHLTESPTASQLNISAFTNNIGNYNLVVPYGGGGQNYVLTPIFQTHQFNPSTRSVFVGDAASVQNGVDFEDISSFRVTGTVLFKGTNCSSKDVFLKVDGENVVQNGQAIKTDAFGNFDMSVPIGQHIISLEKNGHVFEAGRFPPTGSFNFQEPVSGIEFSDSTLRKVVGRVIGGTREAEHLPGLGRSMNNIGIANLTFDPTLTCGWITDPINGIVKSDTSIVTDSLTGEYMIALPPLVYTVKDVGILSNSGVDLGVNRNLDLSILPFELSVVDTVFQTGTNNIIKIDALSYHKQWDYIYRVGPSIDVMDQNGIDPFLGDEDFVFSHSKFGTQTISLLSNIFPYPVFTQNRIYNALISTFEEYVNMDGQNDIFDKVPVTDGILVINNELAANPILTIDLSGVENYEGDTLYSFLAGQANIAENIITPEYSFTKLFKIDLQVGAQATAWEPISGSIPTNGDKFYRGYIMGARDIEQSDFVTQGPELVDYILRDPPGSQSFATRTVGNTHSSTSSWEWNIAGDVNVDKGIHGGVEFQSGFGYSTTTATKADVSLGAEIQASGGEGRSVVEFTTNTQEWSTSAEPLLAGAQSDLFIGTSRNYLFGQVTSLEIIRSSLCDSSTE